MLDEAGEVSRAGSARQLRFDFLDAPVPATDTAAERLAWETEVLGQPVSVHPLALVNIPRGATPLRRLPASPGKPVTVYAVRVPGWPGGPGIFIGDGDTYAVARFEKGQAAGRIRRPYWRPMRLSGRWLRDEWNGGWLEVDEFEAMGSKE